MSAQHSRRSMYFLYGDERIYFDCIPRLQITDRVLIKVHPDCRIVVSAPEGSDDQTVLNAVQKRRRWIYQQLRDFRQQLAYITPRKYISGESHYYLGKQYLLKVLVEPASAQGVKMLRGKLEVITHDRDAEKVLQLLINWYKVRAKEVFIRRLDAMLEQTLWVSERPQLRLLTMQTQWGSCSPGGRLTLNPYLVKAPRECIDYVILHELCHIAEHNHSERFYRLMGQVMPEWEVVKTRLDEMAGVIFSDL